MSDPNVVVARNTDKAPVSDLYSQTVAFSHYNNLSAQLPIDPATGVMPEDVAAQTKQSLTNGKAIVEAAGGSMADVVKTPGFLADMNDLAAMNAVYA